MDSLGNLNDWLNAVVGVCAGWLGGIFWYRRQVIPPKEQALVTYYDTVTALEKFAYSEQIFPAAPEPIDPSASDAELLLTLDAQVRVAKATKEPDRRIAQAVFIFANYRRARGL